ncbi:MAG: hypothetical protein WCD18_22940 [Thermosynechococcaceae cyanobacterium]
MSDFLTHLASRSVNRLTVVQPRLASRFEAHSAPPRLDPQNAGFMALETEATLAAQESGGLALSRQARPQDSGSQSERVARRRIDATQSLAVGASEDQPPQNSVMESSTLESRAIAARPSENNAMKNSPLESRVIAHPLPEDTNPIAPNMVSPQPLRSFSSLSHSSPQMPVQPLASPVDSVERVTSREPAALTERREVFPQIFKPDEPSIVPTNIRVQPQVTSRLESSPESIPTVAAPQPATIHVAIGRIEVRAQTAAPPKASPRRPAPALTLDHYLSQRAGGQP